MTASTVRTLKLLGARSFCTYVLSTRRRIRMAETFVSSIGSRIPERKSHPLNVGDIIVHFLREKLGEFSYHNHRTYYFFPSNISFQRYFFQTRQDGYQRFVCDHYVRFHSIASGFVTNAATVAVVTRYFLRSSKRTSHSKYSSGCT